jgi:hypothetical protein
MEPNASHWFIHRYLNQRIPLSTRRVKALVRGKVKALARGTQIFGNLKMSKFYEYHAYTCSIQIRECYWIRFCGVIGTRPMKALEFFSLLYNIG